MNRALLYPVVTLALAMTAPAANAAVFIFQGTFSGLSEVPPADSPGTGAATVTYDNTAHTLQVTATFSGLTTPTVAAHIHVAPTPGANGPVATQVPSFAGFPLGVTSGSFNNVFDLTQAASWNPAFIASNGGVAAGAEAALALGLHTGRAYMNIHTTRFPGGEIRADLVAIPEPATWGIMVAGFALAGSMLRRRPKIRLALA